ncbi:MAG: hypothetical protein SFY80_16410 [Verrucomicrobiota bacterium]|nr:hypothetical protein [Verrucomicrobiota bacterium]
MRAVLKHLLRRHPGGLPKWPFLSCHLILLAASLYVLAVHHPLDPITVALCFFVALAGVGLLMLPYYMDNQAVHRAQEHRRRMAVGTRAVAPKKVMEVIQAQLPTPAPQVTKPPAPAVMAVLEAPVVVAPVAVTPAVAPFTPPAPAAASPAPVEAAAPASTPVVTASTPPVPPKAATPSLFPPEVMQQVRLPAATAIEKPAQPALPTASVAPAQPTAQPARGSLLGKAFATAQSPAHTQAVNRLIQTGFRKDEPKPAEPGKSVDAA